jgi:hypothetical protein
LTREISTANSQQKINRKKKVQSSTRMMTMPQKKKSMKSNKTHRAAKSRKKEVKENDLSDLL